jgi:hypothetical protein
MVIIELIPTLLLEREGIINIMSFKNYSVRRKIFNVLSQIILSLIKREI